MEIPEKPKKVYMQKAAKAKQVLFPILNPKFPTHLMNLFQEDPRANEMYSWVLAYFPSLSINNDNPPDTKEKARNEKRNNRSGKKKKTHTHSPKNAGNQLFRMAGQNRSLQLRLWCGCGRLIQDLSHTDWFWRLWCNATMSALVRLSRWPVWLAPWCWGRGRATEESLVEEGNERIRLEKRHPRLDLNAVPIKIQSKGYP